MAAHDPSRPGLLDPDGEGMGFAQDAEGRLARAADARAEEALRAELDPDRPRPEAFGAALDVAPNDPEAAIDALLTARTGHVRGAIDHPELGPIDFVWGETGAVKKSGFGLAKIERWHPEALPRLPDILERGRVILSDTPQGQATFILDGEPPLVAVVRRNWKGDPQRWVLTAYGDEKGQTSSLAKTEDARQAGRIDEPPSSAPLIPDATGQSKGSAPRPADQAAPDPDDPEGALDWARAGGGRDLDAVKDEEVVPTADLLRGLDDDDTLQAVLDACPIARDV